jgi:uncharacterized membrane protein YeaQ/YmgE (transglycosylase-associated protein family)
MGIIGWVVLGFFAGLIAKAIYKGDAPQGLIATTVVGVLGALVGGFIASALDVGEIEEFFDIGTWAIAIGGSFLLLVVYNAVDKR